jgi:hypothetical protein
MSYKFTVAEQSELNAAYAMSSQTKYSGNFVPLYTKLSAIIQRHIGQPGSLDSTTIAELKSAKLWLDVAIGANGDIGSHSAFIRTYTAREGELRTGVTFTPAQIQVSSNVVALNLWENLTNPKERHRERHRVRSQYC